MELRDMPEPDGPLTGGQLDAVARTHFCEQMMRSGMTPGEAGQAWDESVDGVRQIYRELMRGPTCTANAHWGNHVRNHQARLLRERGDARSALAALDNVIRDNPGPGVAARLIRDLLDLP